MQEELWGRGSSVISGLECVCEMSEWCSHNGCTWELVLEGIEVQLICGKSEGMVAVGM